MDDIDARVMLQDFHDEAKDYELEKAVVKCYIKPRFGRHFAVHVWA